MQVVDMWLYTTQQHFTSDLYTPNPPQTSTVTIHDVTNAGPKKKVMIAFTDDPTEIKTIELATEMHSKFWIWTKEHKISSVILPDPPMSPTRDTENRSEACAPAERDVPQETSEGYAA